MTSHVSTILDHHLSPHDNPTSHSPDIIVIFTKSQTQSGILFPVADRAGGFPNLKPVSTSHSCRNSSHRVRPGVPLTHYPNNMVQYGSKSGFPADRCYDITASTGTVFQEDRCTEFCRTG